MRVHIVDVELKFGFERVGMLQGSLFAFSKFGSTKNREKSETIYVGRAKNCKKGNTNTKVHCIKTTVCLNYNFFLRQSLVQYCNRCFDAASAISLISLCRFVTILCLFCSIWPCNLKNNTSRGLPSISARQHMHIFALHYMNTYIL